MMNFKDFPVVETSDFETVIIDATRWADDYYTLNFSFFKNFASETDPEIRGQGYVWCTQIDGENLHELYHKVNTMIELGLFDGVTISGHGSLYEEGDIVDEICWTSIGDSHFDCDDEIDITNEILTSSGRTLH